MFGDTYFIQDRQIIIEMTEIDKDVDIYRKQCPGSQDIKRPKPEYLKCHKCGAEVEIWSDELNAECEDCGAVNDRERKATCLDWCKFAVECVGEEKYKKWKGEP